MTGKHKFQPRFSALIFVQARHCRQLSVSIILGNIAILLIHPWKYVFG